jgi:hypothetical protein
VAPADQAHEQEETPGGPVTLGGQRRHDAEPLGSVVQREPDDEDGGQADIANCGAAADIRARTLGVITVRYHFPRP